MTAIMPVFFILFVFFFLCIKEQFPMSFLANSENESDEATWKWTMLLLLLQKSQRVRSEMMSQRGWECNVHVEAGVTLDRFFSHVEVMQNTPSVARWHCDAGFSGCWGSEQIIALLLFGADVTGSVPLNLITTLAYNQIQLWSSLQLALGSF